MQHRRHRRNQHPTEWLGARLPHHGGKLRPDTCPECNLPRRGPHSLGHERCFLKMQDRLDAEMMARKRPS